MICIACTRELPEKKFAKHRRECQCCRSKQAREKLRNGMGEEAYLAMMRMKDRARWPKRRAKQLKRMRLHTKEYRKHYSLKHWYGIGLADYQRILAGQNRKCAICSTTVNQDGRMLYVDHDHDSGKVRGLLCYKCNTALGNFNDDWRLVQQALVYLLNFVKAYST